MPPASQGVFPILPYPDPRAAIAWLARAFGAVPTAVHPPEEDQPLVHAELRVGDGTVMLDRAGRTDGPVPASGPVSLYVVVTDPDALHRRARDAGAEILMGLTDQPYGSREFICRDPGGNAWCFGTYRPGAEG